jgi:hypothetical protein
LLNTIDRTGKVLNLFTAETPEWGVTEVATTLELQRQPPLTSWPVSPKSACCNKLQTTDIDSDGECW